MSARGPYAGAGDAPRAAPGPGEAVPRETAHRVAGGLAPQATAHPPAGADGTASRGNAADRPGGERPRRAGDSSPRGGGQRRAGDAVVRATSRPAAASLESLGVRSRVSADAASTRGLGPAAGGAWVLLRGLTRESRHWGDFPLLLRAELGRPEVVMLDLPGNGVLHAERSRSRVEEMAGFCRAQLMRRAIDPPYRVLGLSLGAMVAVAWAAHHPGEVAAAVLVNTSLRPYGHAAQRLRPAAWPALLRLALLDASPRRREEAVLRMTAAHPPADREALLRDWVAWRDQCPVSRANALRQLWAAARYRAPAAPPLERVLILAGRRDALVDPECSRRLAGAWQAELREHPDAGHDLPLDDGGWVARQIRLWLVAEATAHAPAAPAHDDPSGAAP